MSEQSKYVLHTIAAEPRGGLSINNDGPHILIDDARSNQNMLGVLPTVHSDGPNWVCILPLQQPRGGQEGQSYAGMNTLVTDKWCTIDELSHDLLAPNMRFMIQHLEEPGTAIGFNYSLDPRTRMVEGAEKTKFKPNSWDHFHMHWMAGIDNATQEVSAGDKVTIQAGRWSMDVRPHRYLSEMLPHIVDSVLDQEYRKPELQLNGLDEYILDTEERATLPYAPAGGIVFTLPGELYADPTMLSRAIKDAHDGFAKVHRNIWDLFVANYDVVNASGWAEPYDMRSQDEINIRLESFTNDESVRDGISRFFSVLRPESEVANPMNWLYKSPSHSIAVYKHENEYILSVLPHLMHPTNWLAALGIFEARQAHDADLDGHRAQALAHANRLGATALPSVSPGLAQHNSI